MTDPTERTEDQAAVVEVQAAHLAAVDTAHEDSADAIAARLEFLLENPAERDTGIVTGYAGYLATRSLEAGEDPELVWTYWMSMRETLALSWSDLHAIPERDRTDDWQYVENMMLAWCQEQAELDSGMIRSVLAAVAEAAPGRARAFNRLSLEDARKLGKAAGFGNRSKALRLAALEGRLAETEDEAAREKLTKQIRALRRRRVG